MAPKACCKSLWTGMRTITVEPVLLLFMFSSFLTFSAFMALTYDKSCRHLYNATFCVALDNSTFATQYKNQQDEVQELSSSWIMRSNIAITVPATVSLLLWLGSWGDRVGRRLPVIIPCVTDLLYSVCNLVNAVYMDWSPDYLMIGPVFSGIGGSHLAALMACYTYLTHLVAPEVRMMRVGIAEASTFLAGCISVFVSGRLVDTLGYVPVFGICLGFQALAVLYSLVILPDIKPVTTDKSVTDSCTICCKGVCCRPVCDLWKFVTTPREARVKLHLTLLILVLDILQLCTTGESDILLLYLKRAPRSWSYTMYGYFKGGANFTRGFAVLVFLPLLKRLTSLRDTTLILAGLVSKAAGLVLLGLAPNIWSTFLVLAVGMLQGFPSAGLRSSMAALVQTDEQGRLFGIVASTESVVTFVSTLLFNGIYPLTLDIYDGLCFQIAAGLVAICFCIILFMFTVKFYCMVQEESTSHIRNTCVEHNSTLNFLAMTYDKSCRHLYNETFCVALDNRTFAKQHKHQQNEVQELSSSWIMRSNIAMTVPATLSLLLWMGSWGDRVGRRLPVIFPCITDLLYSVCNLVNAVYMDWSLDYLMIGPVFSGAGGSYLAALMACYTYLTHLAVPEARMMRVGIAEAATFLAGTISVFVSGRLVDTLGYIPVFGICLGFQAITLLYSLVILPDIKPVTNDKSVTDSCTICCRGICFRPVRDLWRFVTTPREARVKLHLTLLILVLDILQLCTTGESDILLLYLKRAPRSWSYTTYGYFKGGANFTRGFAVLVLLPLLKRLTSLRDTTLILAGLVSKAAGLVLLGLAPNTWSIFLVMVAAMLQGFPAAGLRSAMAALVQTDEQGRLFGIVASSESVVTFVSTLLFNGIYPLTLDIYDGLCFQIAAGLVVICFCIILCLHVNARPVDDNSTHNNNSNMELKEDNSVSIQDNSKLN